MFSLWTYTKHFIVEKALSIAYNQPAVLLCAYQIQHWQPKISYDEECHRLSVQLKLSLIISLQLWGGKTRIRLNIY